LKLLINKKDALIIVDVQRDFCKDGALPVPKGQEVVPVLNKYIRLFKTFRAPIFVTRDWHPKNHISFKDFGGIWPPHCIKESEGAMFHPDLKLTEEIKIISKATDPNEEAYSGFSGTDLKNELIRKDVKRIFVGGLATDYCVKNTVLDAIKHGFETFLLADAIRGVNIESKDSEKAIKEMVQKGAKKITFNEFSQE
jgi:nicotinamidase/pyrazinamidase